MKGQSHDTAPLGEESRVIGAAMGEDQAPIRPNAEAVVNTRAATVNVSNDGTQPLKPGEQTVLVNASIVDLDYEAEYAPWLVELEIGRE